MPVASLLCYIAAVDPSRAHRHNPHARRENDDKHNPQNSRNYTGQLQGRGVPRSQVEAYIRTQLSFSAGCCRDACRFNFMLCGCEAGVAAIAVRLLGDATTFAVLMQQGGLACGFSVIAGDACPAAPPAPASAPPGPPGLPPAAAAPPQGMGGGGGGGGGAVLPRASLGARLATCGALQGSPAGTSAPAGAAAAAGFAPSLATVLPGDQQQQQQQQPAATAAAGAGVAATVAVGPMPPATPLPAAPTAGEAQTPPQQQQQPQQPPAPPAQEMAGSG